MMDAVSDIATNVITTFMFFFANMGLKYSIFVSLGVVGTQYAIMWYEKNYNDHSKDRKRRRERHNLMGETFTSIKMIKLFGWESLMGERIKAQRVEDRKWEYERRHRGWLTGYMHRFQHFMSPIVVYCAYAWSGKTISLAFLNLAQTYIWRLHSLRHHVPRVKHHYK
jgi:ABC-type multidrug transport system fused ATPase/permease subunit